MSCRASCLPAQHGDTLLKRGGIEHACSGCDDIALRIEEERSRNRGKTVFHRSIISAIEKDWERIAVARDEVLRALLSTIGFPRNCERETEAPSLSVTVKSGAMTVSASVVFPRDEPAAFCAPLPESLEVLPALDEPVFVAAIWLAPSVAAGASTLYAMAATIMITTSTTVAMSTPFFGEGGAAFVLLSASLSVRFSFVPIMCTFPIR